ncbi:Activator of (R)-2-hydroxyglutaryl-CoA dehydratase [Desulfosporosinus sp. I2]|uniref:acyl-CoA dehydratase activase-related protein n=1 Tax=Desulfosporosinus sp. I2 TaxID=1617025 RepID=UPI0005EE12A2|nr:acyl-CoA dehydratase activase-related protein [Desulfosporosinus sp. I2]KJR48586.1 Activator of (R)-2-hydroxyglutaryl-CoA dehydratase [Desulfosporosinus sp. I2]
MKIGFPRALYYFDFFPFWTGFFHQLNIEVVISPPTNRQIMDLGLKNASDETCLPLKLLSGHIQALKAVDWVFLPRMVSVEAETYTCPKFLGIPESLLSSVPTGIPVLTVTLNWRKGQRLVLKDLQKMGETLGKSKIEIKQAFYEGQKWQEKFQKTRGAEWNFEESIREIENLSTCLVKPQPTNPQLLPEPDRLKIALVGHSYLIQESYANLNLLKKLREKARVELIQHVDQNEIETNLLELRKKLFWSHSKQIYGAGNKFLADPEIDGIIYLTCFGCGTDSIVQELLSRKARQRHKPYMVITLDEHSGEAGLITRLEAFLDMVERRRVHEGYVSTHGERLDCYSNTL